MTYRIVACAVGSLLVLVGACDRSSVDPQTAPLTASTTAAPLPPVATTTAPTSAPQPSLRTVEVAPPATTTTTTTVPAVTQRQYPMYERSPEVVELQMVLDLKSVDGVYGPITRRAHIEYLGGPLVALSVFHPEFADLDTGSASARYSLGELIRRHFRRDDRSWALRVAFCESSADPSDVSSVEVSSALALGWFQHLAKFWVERSDAAGWSGHHPFHGEANVAVAAWLFYEGGGERHWNPSRTCWEET